MFPADAGDCGGGGWIFLDVSCAIILRMNKTCECAAVVLHLFLCFLSLTHRLLKPSRVSCPSWKLYQTTPRSWQTSVCNTRLSFHGATRARWFAQLKDWDLYMNSGVMSPRIHWQHGGLAKNTINTNALPKQVPNWDLPPLGVTVECI